MKKYLLILLVIFTVGATTFGATTKKLSKLKFEEDMDFNGTKLSDALALMSKVSDITMVADSDVKDVVIDLYINKGQSLREVLDIIEVTNGLEETSMGEIIILNNTGRGSTILMGKIAGDTSQGLEGVKISLVDSGYDSVRTEVGGVFIYDNIKSGIYILKLEKDGYSTSSEVVEVKQNQTTNIDINLDKQNKEGLVVEKKEEGVRGKELGRSKNTDGVEVTTERIELKHADVDDIKEVVDSIFGETLTVTTLSKLHLLILKGDKDDIDTAKKLIDDMDRPVKQVRITAQILETTDDLLEELGFDWLFSNTDSDVSSTSSDTEGISASIASAASNTLNFIDIFGDENSLLDLSISLLQSTDDMTVSSVPSVVVVNGEEAEFKVTEEVIVGETTETDDDGNETTEPIWEEAGTIFTVTPTIREGGDEPDTIILELASEISTFELESEYDGDAGGKNTNNITTKIQMTDGDVIFIGGLKESSISESVYKIPYLGDIPGLGSLFRSTSTDNEVKQIYIQITAEIVTDENKNIDVDYNKFKKNGTSSSDYKRIFPNFDTEEENGIDL